MPMFSSHKAEKISPKKVLTLQPFQPLLARVEQSHCDLSAVTLGASD